MSDLFYLIIVIYFWSLGALILLKSDRFTIDFIILWPFFPIIFPLVFVFKRIICMIITIKNIKHR